MAQFEGRGGEGNAKKAKTETHGVDVIERSVFVRS